MSPLKRFFILGFIFMLMSISPSAYAIYSPVISSNAAQIRDHIIASQAQNGIGSLMEISTSIVNQAQAKAKAGQISGASGQAQQARKKIAATAALQAIREPLDGLMMIFNILPSKGGGAISNCLRNDIWTLESLRDVVGEEMVKAYMLGDIFHGDQLSKDYDYLVEQIDLLKRHGNDPNAKLTTTIIEDGKEKVVNISMKQYLFGDETGTYYYSLAFPSDQGCPEGDFEKAFIKVKNSAQTLATLSSGQGTADWGSIWEMAQVRAKQRAAQWFAANQISLTLGGGQGGQSNSLVKNNGWAQRAAELKTQVRMLKNLLGPVTAPFSLDIYERIDGVDYIGGESSCAFYEYETQKYYPCSSEQLETFNTCNLTVATAKKQGRIDKDLSRAKAKAALEELQLGLNCWNFRDPHPYHSLTEFWQSEADAQEKSALNFENELTAFYYQVELNDIGESTLDQLSDSLVSFENEIKRGVEASGTPEKDKGLSTFAEYMKTMINRHCTNRDYGTK